MKINCDQIILIKISISSVYVEKYVVFFYSCFKLFLLSCPITEFVQTLRHYLEVNSNLFEHRNSSLSFICFYWLCLHFILRILYQKSAHNNAYSKPGGGRYDGFNSFVKFERLILLFNIFGYCFFFKIVETLLWNNSFFCSMCYQA